MIHKTFVEMEGQLVARVTFSLPDSIWADRITLVGDFNCWDTRSHPLSRTRTGTWFITVDLEARRACQFRYLRGDDQWMNDQEADAHVHNIYGTDNFVVITDPDYKRHADQKESHHEHRNDRLGQNGRQYGDPLDARRPLGRGI